VDRTPLLPSSPNKRVAAELTDDQRFIQRDLPGQAVNFSGGPSYQPMYLLQPSTSRDSPSRSSTTCVLASA